MTTRTYVFVKDVACPTCKAEVNQGCQRGAVGPMRSGKFHVARQRLALAQNHRIKREGQS